ncbi:MAG: MoxR family ATPase [Acidobacteriota bacterium]|nr:MoxR family ATPase [Acidobacteriota bacterium]
MTDASQAFRYTSLIDLSPEEEIPGNAASLDAPDPRDGRIYVHDDVLKLAAEVALATGRPLLLRGKPGTGKSSFAAYLARRLGWRYYEHVFTARSQAQDLLWRFDAVRRLGDAQVRRREDPPLHDADYVEPGVLWWVFDRASALRRGASPEHPVRNLAVEPLSEFNAGRSPDHAVVLLDEIDKADPDVPNNLLVPLGSLQFRVDETGAVIRRHPQAGEGERVSRLLVVLTTNEERDLPQAFLRRCVVHKLEEPDLERLVTIARRHFDWPGEPLTGDRLELCRALAGKILELRIQALELGVRPPSTAEFLDAVRACLTLKIGLDAPEWVHLERVVWRKGDEGEREP